MSLVTEKRSKPEEIQGRYDPVKRRRSQRTGRSRGCWVYIPMVDLIAAGFSPDEPPPYYRTWGDERGGVVVRLYREQ